MGEIMKKILLLFTLLTISVMTTACINNLAIEELNNKAVKYMNNGDTEIAICRLKSSLDLDNEIYQTHYNLALAYNTIGNYEGAVQELNKVLELKPDFYDALYSLAVAKQALALKIITKEADENGNTPEITPEEMEEFNLKANEVIDIYNKYLVENIAAAETEKINEQIAELNAQIKEFSFKLENKSMNNVAPQEQTQEQTQDQTQPAEQPQPQMQEQTKASPEQ